MVPFRVLGLILLYGINLNATVVSIARRSFLPSFACQGRCLLVCASRKLRKEDRTDGAEKDFQVSCILRHQPCASGDGCVENGRHAEIEKLVCGHSHIGCKSALSSEGETGLRSPIAGQAGVLRHVSYLASFPLHAWPGQTVPSRPQRTSNWQRNGMPDGFVHLD